MGRAMNEALDLFLASNPHIKVRPDFKSGTTRYVGLGDNPLTEPELRNTVEFIGFTDGLYNNENRFKRGTAKGLMTFGTKKVDLEDNIDAPIQFEVRASDLSSESENLYDNQYELGKSRRPDLRRKT